MNEKFYDGGKAYRALPFWAWNTVITEDKVREQVRMFADMGMGGFVIHSRNGLRTEYMGKHFKYCPICGKLIKISEVE